MEGPSSKRFEVRRRIGEGGMGVVFEAFDVERRVPVALKALSRVDGAALARFKHEFRALQGLSHPNLVALDELFFEDGQWFFTMELLDGEDFVSYVRGAASTRAALLPTMQVGAPGGGAARGSGAPPRDDTSGFDPERLREGLLQLARGLGALHAAGKVHRDIKPSNVLVTRVAGGASARVVLLDFGLVTEASSDRQSTGAAIVGTPEYMAPEQGGSREIGTPADLYALGVMLYEALTGTLPFRGAPLQILIDKQGREPPLPSSVAAGVPPDLDALCARLLRFDPGRRPTAADVLLVLARGPSPDVAPPRTSSDAPLFVGRGAELDALAGAYASLRDGAPRAVLLCGESGIGKSCIVRRFTGQLRLDDPSLMLLEGRCYEREAVPYKAIDGIVDALGRQLSRMPDNEASAVLPVRAAVLAHVFPAMRRVPQIAKELPAQPSAANEEPQELRRRAFAALRELFTRLALRRPVVLAIDDLQWADDDGLRVLSEILRPPDAPPLLVIGTVRATGTDDPALDRLRAALHDDARVLAVTSLGTEEARRLAEAVLRSAGGPGADLELIAREAGGHPLFVEELARHVARGGSARDEVKLDGAIGARVAILEPQAREVLELVAVAGKPIAQEVVVAAARADPADFSRRVAALRAANLVRTSGARWVDAIEAYHDRVHEAVQAGLDGARRRVLHERLALAFEASPRRDAETLATHWREAGDRPRAMAHAIVAGDQAQTTFAFDRAARWYEQALELAPEGPGRRELRAKLGNALASAGRGALAAPHFEAAAAESDPAEALELRRRVAEELLRSGRFDRGVEVSREVLASIGMRMPTTALGTLLAFFYYRALLRLRGLRFRERTRAQITDQELTRVDTAWAIGFVLGFADTFMGLLYLTRALLLALSAGEIERIIRGITSEVAILGTGGGAALPRMRRLLAHSRTIAERSTSVQARYFANTGPGIGFFLTGNFREAADALHGALDLLKDGSMGIVYEHVNARFFMIESLHYLGGYAELRRLQAEGMRDALDRGDVYAAVCMRVGHPSMAWLAMDRPDVADERAVEALREWSSRSVHLEHILGLVARVHAKLYAGEIEEAYALADEMERRQSASLLWRVQITRLRTIHHRAGTALAMVERGLGDRASLLREVERGASATEREKVAWAQPFASALRAGLAQRQGRRADALARLDAAVRGFEAAQMMGYAMAARDRAARLRRDGTTGADVALVEEYFRAQQVASPERMISTLMPGLAE